MFDGSKCLEKCLKYRVLNNAMYHVAWGSWPSLGYALLCEVDLGTNEGLLFDSW